MVIDHLCVLIETCRHTNEIARLLQKSTTIRPGWIQRRISLLPLDNKCFLFNFCPPLNKELHVAPPGHLQLLSPLNKDLHVAPLKLFAGSATDHLGSYD